MDKPTRGRKRNCLQLKGLVLEKHGIKRKSVTRESESLVMFLKPRVKSLSFFYICNCFFHYKFCSLKIILWVDPL